MGGLKECEGEECRDVVERAGWGWKEGGVGGGRGVVGWGVEGGG